MLSRRDAFAGFALSLGFISSGIASQAWAATTPLGWTPAALTPAQARALDAAAELIVPATDTPGARAVGVPQFIDRAVGNWCSPPQAKLLRSGLDQLDADAVAAHGAPFADLTAAQQTELLTRYDTSGDPQRPFFGFLKELTTIGYFTSKPGATIALRYDPVPGDYRGCVPLKEIGHAWAT
ncbi:MAG: gluconate 2-dehydrogenase subunit 3 family protein [Phenylobacterium sp.]